MNHIIVLFKEFKHKLIWIYLFMLITELLAISQPFLLGKTIDELISGGCFWVILFSISLLSHNFFHYKRMVYDTKVYTEMYNHIVFKFLNNKESTESTKLARTDMANEIVSVLEGYVHYYISTIITIISSVIFILSINVYISLTLLIVTIIILYIVVLFRHKIKQSINIRNNHYETKGTAISNGIHSSINFFNRLRKLNIFESTIQGKNWFMVGIFKNLFLIVSIIILIKTTENITIGLIFMIYGYINSYLVSLMSIPVSFEMYSRINDITKRLN